MGSSKGSIKEAREALEEKLIVLPGIAGIAHTEEEIIVFLEDEAAGKDVPDRFEGFPVRKRVTGKFEALGLALIEAEVAQASVGVTRTDVVRPLVGGISLSAYIEKRSGRSTTVKKYAGTLGMVTYDDKILSCAHVIAMDPDTAEFLDIGTPVVQPGTYDGGTLDDKVGELEKYIPIKFWRGTNYADAAIATFVEGVSGISGEQFDERGNYTISGATEVKEGETVRKSGRTTGVTESTVVHTNATVWVWYAWTKRALFKDQILVEQPFMESGDSGSAVDKDGAFVGLAFAASDEEAVVCKAKYIIDGLEIEV